MSDKEFQGRKLEIDELDEMDVVFESNWLNGKRLNEMLGTSQYISVTITNAEAWEKLDSRGNPRLVFESEIVDGEGSQYKIDFTPNNINQLARIVCGWQRGQLKPKPSQILGDIIDSTVKIGAELNNDGQAYHVDVISAKEITSFSSVKKQTATATTAPATATRNPRRV